jgi:alpha-ribazole phosphatase
MAGFTIWRHPKPRGVGGRCIGGRTDLPVDPRKAKRLAHRIRAYARRKDLPREVVTSPLRRAADVGRWLKRWGFLWHVDAALREVDFGAWDGHPWHNIPPAEFARWTDDFAYFDFEGGETLDALLVRAKAWAPPAGFSLVVGHGGWMSARAWATNMLLSPSTWPNPPAYGQPLVFEAGDRIRS